MLLSPGQPRALVALLVAVTKHFPPKTGRIYFGPQLERATVHLGEKAAVTLAAGAGTKLVYILVTNQEQEAQGRGGAGPFPTAYS